MYSKCRSSIISIISTRTKWGSQRERFEEVQEVKRIRNDIKTSRPSHRLSVDLQQKWKTFMKKHKERT